MSEPQHVFASILGIIGASGLSVVLYDLWLTNARERRRERALLEREDKLVAGHTRSTLIEQLAAIEHERWADYMRYFFGKLDAVAEDIRGTEGEFVPGSALIIPPDYVEALRKLVDTPYAELTEEQKENDRREVRRYLHLFPALGLADAAHEGQR